MPSLFASVAVVAALVLTHLGARHLHFLTTLPRSVWLSFAGGASVAYVFLHLLPEVSAHAEALRESVMLEHTIYLAALVGLVVFYGLEQLARKKGLDGPGGSSTEEEAEEARGVFWLHVACFALYNVVVGCLVAHFEGDATRELLVFGLAMVLHFLVNDLSLSHTFADLYDRRGRWILALAVVAGFGLGWAEVLPESVFALLVGLVAGIIVLTVLKEELPEDRQSRFWAFLLGAVSYALLLAAA